MDGMPQQEIAFLRQKAVLWPFVSYDINGQLQVGPPVEIRVRWNNKQTQTLDPKGNTITLDASVTVDREILPNSCMWLGTLKGMEALGVNITGVMEVKYYSTTPDIKGRAYKRSVQLMRRKDGLPPLA